MDETWYQSLFFSSLLKTLKSKFKKLPLTTNEISTDKLYNRFMFYAFDESFIMNEMSLKRIFTNMFMKDFILAVVLMTLSELLLLVSPLLLPYFILFINYEIIDTYYGWIIAGTIVLSQIVKSFLHYHSLHISFMIGLKIRSVMTNAIFRKLLKLDDTLVDIGGLFTTLSVDVNAFLNTIITIVAGIAACFSFIGALVILYINIGWISVIFMSVFFIIVPLSWYLAEKVLQNSMGMKGKSDMRYKILSLFLSKIIEYKSTYLENVVFDDLKTIRKIEISFARNMMMLSNLSTTISNILGIVIVEIILVLYWYFYPNTFTVSIIFSTISLISIMNKTALLVPQVYTTLNTFMGAIRRFQRILGVPDNTIFPSKRKGTGLLKIQGTFSDEGGIIFDQIDISLRKGELGFLYGHQGSGKSTILKTLCGHLQSINSVIEIGGSVSIVSQEPWILHGTVKENIILGEPYDRKKYNQVLSICNLNKDIMLMENDSDTKIHNNSKFLSQGQKIKINVARCLYKDSNIYIFDDIFTRLNPRTQESIFLFGIRKKLISNGKTVLIITSQTNYIQYADQIFYLDNKRIIEQGTYEELVENDTLFSRSFHRTNDTVNHDKINDQHVDLDSMKIIVPKNTQFGFIRSMFKFLNIIKSKQVELVGFDEYKFYLKYSRRSIVMVVVLLCLIYVTTRIMIYWFYSIWSNSHVISNNSSSLIYVILLTIFNLTAILSFFGINILWYFITKRISINMHNDILEKFKNAIPNFYLYFSEPKLISVLTRDLRIIDTTIPSKILSFSFSSLNVLYLFGSVAVNQPPMLILIIPFLLFIVYLQSYFETHQVYITRKESNSREPIVGTFLDIFKITHIIRIMNVGQHLTRMNSMHLDKNTNYLYLSNYSKMGFSLLLDIVTQFTFLLTLSALIVFRIFGYSDSITAGVIISVAGSITTAIADASRILGDIHQSMFSIDNMMKYENIEVENVTGEYEENWPVDGHIQFQNVSVLKDGTKVLDNINAVFNPGSKVAILGRTGSGKTVLTQSILRNSNYTGTILIDDENILQLPVNQVRSSISILFEEPVLFFGSIRKNLDTEDRYKDFEIWKILNKVSLKEKIVQLTDQLDTPLSKVYFSKGERQLLCLARELLHQNKIIIFDEIGSSLDEKTDNIFQRVVRKHMKNVTIISVTNHYLSIMDYDYVYVMHRGKIIDSGNPAKLLQKKNKGPFKSLLKESGIKKYLKKLAFHQSQYYTDTTTDFFLESLHNF